MRTLVKMGIALGIVVVAAIVAVVIIVNNRPPTVEPPAAGGTRPSAIAENTYVLGEPGDGSITLVEFIDFECEACGAFYPYVEQLRKDYAGQVTFAFRYFPLPSHGNSVNAAVAVEAAGRQGALEPMYKLMFETQATWGEKGAESQAPLFRVFAEQLGLDLQQYDRDVADPAVAARVQSDFDAGVALGVQSTPTFFLNDRALQLTSYDGVRQAIEAELAK